LDDTKTTLGGAAQAVPPVDPTLGDDQTTGAGVGATVAQPEPVTPAEPEPILPGEEVAVPTAGVKEEPVMPTPIAEPGTEDTTGGTGSTGLPNQ